MSSNLTYESSGVSIDRGDELVSNIKKIVSMQSNPFVLSGLGGFSGLFELPRGYKNPVLVSGTDGVGTKLKLAFDTDKHDTIGYDLVAMSVNDILVSGAKPLFFLDYYATSQLEVKTATKVVKGIYEACDSCGVALLGGETAELPGFYKTGEYDLAGFAVGIVEKSDIPSVKNVKAGDIIIGLPSSGLHSNGFSLARKAIFQVLDYNLNDKFKDSDLTVAEVLLQPTIIYVKPVLEFLKHNIVKTMVHVTGGGLVENPPRAMPSGLGMDIKKSSWNIPPIFKEIQKAGISETEMYRTFNMGLGFLITVSPDKLSLTKSILENINQDYYEIGVVSERENGKKYTRFL